MATVKRDQILQEADKLAGRGKVDAAIKEYRRALDLAPNDTNTLNRLGDLLVKANRIPEAIEVYQKIAEHFSRDGFFLKAIAIYKKVNRLDPQKVEIYEQLADLYFKQGLAVEGRQQLLTLADWFLRSKQPSQAVRVYRRLVDLEPSNLQARAKLVDLFVQLEDKESVAEEISTFGKLLLGKGMLDEAAKLFHRAVDLVPDQIDLIAPCIDAMISGGRVAQAGELADRVLAANPKPGVELAQAIARTRMEAGDLGQAREILEGILPEAGERTAVIQLYGDLMLRVGEISQARDRMLPVVDRLLDAGDRGRASALVRRLLRSAPGDLQVLEQATRVITRRDDKDMAVTLEAALADALLREGRREEAARLYIRLSREDPDNRLFRQRLDELGQAGAESAPAATSPPVEPVSAPPPVEHPAADDVVVSEEGVGAGVGPLDDPASSDFFGVEEDVVYEDVELEFVEVDIPGEAAQHPQPRDAAQAPSAEVLSFPPAAVAVPVTDEIPEIGEERPPPPPGADGEELLTEALVFIKYGLTDKAVSHLYRVLEVAPEHARARELLTSLGVTLEGEGEFQEAPPDGVAPPELAEPERAQPEPSVAAKPSLEAPPSAVPPLEPEVPQPPAQRQPATVSGTSVRSAAASGSFKLDELEAMLGIGRRSIKASPPPPAPDPVPEPVEGALGFDPAAALGEQEVQPETFSWSVGAEHPVDVPVAEPPMADSEALPQEHVVELNEVEKIESVHEEVEELSPAEELVDVGSMLAGPAQEQLGEVDLFLGQGLLDDAAEGLQALQQEFPGHSDVVSRLAVLKAKGWEESALAGAEVTAEELFSEEEQFFDLAAELERELAEDDMVAEAAGTGEGTEESIEDLFREFQRGVAEQIGEEDHDTHFNLGLAYREMGLLDEAIGEFQLASKSPQLFVECASMIAACYVDRGLPDAAAEWYQRALSAPEVAPEAEVGLRYELARAQEIAGNTSAALGHYAEVLAINPGFRDVVDRVSRLRSN